MLLPWKTNHPTHGCIDVPVDGSVLTATSGLIKINNKAELKMLPGYRATSVVRRRLAAMPDNSDGSSMSVYLSKLDIAEINYFFPSLNAEAAVEAWGSSALHKPERAATFRLSYLLSQTPTDLINRDIDVLLQKPKIGGTNVYSVKDYEKYIRDNYNDSVKIPFEKLFCAEIMRKVIANLIKHRKELPLFVGFSYNIEDIESWLPPINQSERIDTDSDEYDDFPQYDANLIVGEVLTKTLRSTGWQFKRMPNFDTALVGLVATDRVEKAAQSALKDTYGSTYGLPPIAQAADYFSETIFMYGMENLTNGFLTEVSAHYDNVYRLNTLADKAVESDTKVSHMDRVANKILNNVPYHDTVLVPFAKAHLATFRKPNATEREQDKIYADLFQEMIGHRQIE